MTPSLSPSAQAGRSSASSSAASHFFIRKTSVFHSGVLAKAQAVSGRLFVESISFWVGLQVDRAHNVAGNARKPHQAKYCVRKNMRGVPLYAIMMQRTCTGGGNHHAEMDRAAARRHRRPGHSLIVCAAAGSSKTAVLVERIVQLVRGAVRLKTCWSSRSPTRRRAKCASASASARQGRAGGSGAGRTGDGAFPCEHLHAAQVLRQPAARALSGAFHRPRLSHR